MNATTDLAAAITSTFEDADTHGWACSLCTERGGYLWTAEDAAADARWHAATTHGA